MAEYLFLQLSFLSRSCEAMRISKTFGERKHVLISTEPKRKYFLAYEGSETERLYFEGIQANKDRFGINILIEIVPILRSFNEAGFSHPIRLLACLKEFLLQIKKGQYKINSIIECTIDYLKEENVFLNSDFSEEKIRDFLVNWFIREGYSLQEDIFTNLDEIIDKVGKSLYKKYQFAI